MPDLSPLVWVAAIAIALLAGFVKGAVGFAMPLIIVSGLTSIMPPHIAVAGIILPIVVSNLIQAFRTGLAPAGAAIRDFWRYVLVVCVAILIFAQFVPGMAPEVFYLVLGVPVVILSILQLSGARMHVPEGQRWWAEWAAGLASGIMGGLAGTWGPTTVLYLLAIDTPKVRQIVVQGVIYGLGSVALLVAHLKSGILTSATAPFSALLVVPALVGMWAGFKAQDRLNQQAFRRVTLAVLVVAGLNLIRKGMGL